MTVYDDHESTTLYKELLGLQPTEAPVCPKVNSKVGSRF